MSSITIPTPYGHDGLLYVGSGFAIDPKKSIDAIRPGAVGDISLKNGETSNEFIAWSHPKAAPYNPSTLILDNRLYVLYDMGLMRCFQAHDGKVLCLNEDGVTFLPTVKQAHENCRGCLNNPR